MIRSRGSAQNRCTYCQRPFPSSTQVTRHVAHSKPCRLRWEKELQRIHIDPGRRHKTDGNGRPEEDLSTNVDIETEDENGDVIMQEDAEFVFPTQQMPETEIELQVEEGVEIEEVREDESDEPKDDAYQHARWCETYPGQAAEAMGTANTTFEEWRQRQLTTGVSEWSPFSNKDEWDTAQWLLKNVGQTAIDEYLKLPAVSQYEYSKRHPILHLQVSLDPETTLLFPQQLQFHEEGGFVTYWTRLDLRTCESGW